MEHGSGRRRRRMYSAEFKAEAVAACRKPHASIAGCALERAINANLLRRWVIEAERPESKPPVPALSAPSTCNESFVRVPLSAQAGDDTPIRIQVRRGPMRLSVQWPRSAMHECAVWLREVLK